MRSPISFMIAAAVLLGFLVLATHPPGGDGRGTQQVSMRSAPTSPAVQPSRPPATSDSRATAGATSEPRATSPYAIGSPSQPTEADGESGHAAHVVRAGARSGNGENAVADGRKVFRKCQACHSTDEGKNLIGPSLAGIVGRKAGSAPGFNYSPALKQSGITWDHDTLAAYLTDPQKKVPGNRMPFPGLKSSEDRENVIAFLAAASRDNGAVASGPAPGTTQAAHQPPAPQAQGTGADQVPATFTPDVKYTLRSGIAEGRMVFIGVGGAIDGKPNPVLSAAVGQVVQVTLINGEGAEHDIAFPDQNTTSPRVTGKGASTTVAFRVTRAGDFTYFCSVPGHRQAGMEGKFLVTPQPPPDTVVQADISREPTDVPEPIDRREPQTVRLDLITSELEGRLADGTTYMYWTFNNKVPGPMVRVRVGDSVEVHLKNSADSSMIHSVDFHAATGPGGGAAALQVDPGAEKSLTFKALTPGLFIYHCATPMVAAHIANGMFGLILVEPKDGLPKVDREFYVMQSEIYTDHPFGQHGSQEFSVEKLLDERPEYLVFNGAVGALTALHPLEANVGETVRIFFGNAGPNLTSSFHVIGEIFDRAYQQGGLTTPALQGVQAITVPPGSAAITDFTLYVPGNYVLVDHALARAERGLMGFLHAVGSNNAEIYNGKVDAAATH